MQFLYLSFEACQTQVAESVCAFNVDVPQVHGASDPPAEKPHCQVDGSKQLRLKGQPCKWPQGTQVSVELVFEYPDGLCRFPDMLKVDHNPAFLCPCELITCY